MIDLEEIKYALNIYTTQEAFGKWFLENELLLSNFFYEQTGKSLYEVGFDLFYYECIEVSPVYQKFQEGLGSSSQFISFLNLISIAAQKLAEVGIPSLSQTLVSDLPESPSKCRLQAVNEIVSIDDVRIDYQKKLPKILSLLDKSRLQFEEEGNRQIVDVLLFYYTKAKLAFEKTGLKTECIQFKELFKDDELNKKYPFLGHQILIDLINDKDPFALYPKIIVRERLEPSLTIQTLFRSFNQDLNNHPKIHNDANNFWGFSRKQILDDVLVRGRGDFTKNYGDITADDKVMLYCYFNLKKHFFTSYAVFQTVVKTLENIFSNEDYRPVFIDLGCGPMTSGLAIGDLIHNTTASGIKFAYVGIDISNQMINKAKKFTDLEIFASESIFKFYNNWNDLTPSILNSMAGKNNPIMFNASYLFASNSLDASDLAQYVSNIAEIYKNVYFVFQNPNRVDRNLKYKEFKERIKAKSLIEEAENIRYKASTMEANEDVSYEILKLIN